MAKNPIFVIADKISLSPKSAVIVALLINLILGLGLFGWQLYKGLNAKTCNTEPNNNNNMPISSITEPQAHNLHLGNGLFHNPNNNELLFGAKTLQYKKLKSFIGYGDIALYDSTVNGTVTVYGDMQTNNVKVNDTIIYGSAKLHDTDIKNRLAIYGEAFIINSNINGNSTIFGTADSDNTVFSGDITAATSKFTLLNSQTKGITIQKSQQNNKQIIKILGKSIINGDITFESGSGIIELGSQAKINGKIHGGSLLLDRK